MVVFAVNDALKKKIAHRQFFGSVSGKVLITLAAICVAAAAGFLLAAPSVLTDVYLHKELGFNNDSLESGRAMGYAIGCGGPLLIAFFLVVCGYRQVTADTAMRKREFVYLDDTGRLVYRFKMSNDFRPNCISMVSIGLSSCSLCAKDGIASFSGDVRAVRVKNWSEDVEIPLDMFGLMTKPFKLGLYFEPDLLEVVRPFTKTV